MESIAPGATSRWPRIVAATITTPGVSTGAIVCLACHRYAIN
jgi:hypothetical protein